MLQRCIKFRNKHHRLGQSCDISHLGKYLRKSRDKYRKKISQEFPKLNENERNNIVDFYLKEELKAGVQTIHYQINTLMTTNG